MINHDNIANLENITDAVLNRYNYEKHSLISILLDIQTNFNYLPKEAMIMVAEELNIRVIDVYSVATFYTVFSLKPRGKYIINVCVGTACHVRGGRRIVDKIQKELNIDVGETTEDMQFTLETVRCLGACALGPVMVINGEYYGQLSTKKANTILQSYKVQEAAT
ncbi:MAG: NADH-quinone oxidoreductase subunit NuoE [Candidatus Thermoplasmatota archaeon]|nr:NADH-quinone oxidoreductase subunit NuoE [Euryarchaeota archaeon]MBU4031491.1 NADH-quinone oxidoreductase subunit NuoE [Candidatus Thermoplasmatota archaeon]MBU4143739.1 NADH-quinone oxidoreductase subunit NuoE [Candidatus Thermoplasmatota archaeon]MBU4592422.1 NADH-quinone oxidoreductase subunit NuoE [Candidatus Thermoplasmatota archaeon]